MVDSVFRLVRNLSKCGVRMLSLHQCVLVMKCRSPVHREHRLYCTDDPDTVRLIRLHYVHHTPRALQSFGTVAVLRDLAIDDFTKDVDSGTVPTKL